MCWAKGCRMQPIDFVSTAPWQQRHPHHQSNSSWLLRSLSRHGPAAAVHARFLQRFSPPVLAVGMVKRLARGANANRQLMCTSMVPVRHLDVDIQWSRVLQLCQTFGGRCQHWENGEYARPISTLSWPAEELCCGFAAGEYTLGRKVQI